MKCDMLSSYQGRILTKQERLPAQTTINRKITGLETIASILNLTCFIYLLFRKERDKGGKIPIVTQSLKDPWPFIIRTESQDCSEQDAEQ